VLLLKRARSCRMPEMAVPKGEPPSASEAARIQPEQILLTARDPEGVTCREVDARAVRGIWCGPDDMALG
jgi:hypothetical protein